MIEQPKKRVILASASPRRRQILRELGADIEIITADTDETCTLASPREYATELAIRKGEAVRNLLEREGRLEGAIIISADTVVACDGRILGKPTDGDDARRMIASLSGKAHSVYTGVAVCYDGKTYSDCSETAVLVDTIPPREIERYIASGEPFDKAGGYGIQGSFSKWIRGIEGCYFGVVGLPVNLTCRLFYEAVGCYPEDV